MKKGKFKKRSFFKYGLTFLIVLFAFYISKKIKLNDNYVAFLTNNYLDISAKKAITTPVLKEDGKPNNIVEKDYEIYIYNTHQNESYAYNKLTSNNIDYTVLYASHILSFYLEDNGYKAYVEDESMTKVLNDNNLQYYQSYMGSRKLLEQSIINHPSIHFFIDLHRDSAPYEATTCSTQGNNYAKVLFVVGKEHPGYEANLALANKLSAKLASINPCLTRGVSQKGGQGVDGIYNQDFNPNAILIEVGGQYNMIEEVDNTLKILASVITEHLQENI